MKSEFALIDWIRKKIPQKLQGPYGIGDDTAILPFKNNGELLFTADTLVENVDFVLKKAKPELVGRKALAVNLSDMAAMGGKPFACLISLGIPPSMNEAWIQKFYSGLLPLAQKYQTLCAGGDISRAKEFFVSIALLGWSPKKKAVERNGARPGDVLLVTGKLGGSILGKHFSFEPRLREAQFLIQNFHPTAMIDISDGLLQDLEHILKESKVGTSVELSAVPVSSDAKKLAKGNPVRALEHALSDGEDFELLFTIPSKEESKLQKLWKKTFPGVSLSRLGRIQSGKPRVDWLRNGKPAAAPLIRHKGYSHF